MERITPSFRVQDVASLLGTNPRRVEGWVEKGFIKPAVRARGTGHRHRFDLSNLVEAALMLELQSVLGEKNRFPGLMAGGGLTKQAAERAARRLVEGDTESDRVLLVAHRFEVGPFNVRYDSLSGLQAFINHAMKAGWTITLVGISGVLMRLHQHLMKWRGKAQKE